MKKFDHPDNISVHTGCIAGVKPGQGHVASLYGAGGKFERLVTDDEIFLVLEEWVQKPGLGLNQNLRWSLVLTRTGKHFVRSCWISWLSS